MSKAPAFQLYAADFYMDTVSWSATQVGLYFRLLMYEWVNGPLPEDINSLARIAGLDPGNFKKCYLQDIAKKFTPDPHGGIVNLRLERTREEQLKWHETQRKRINKRWGNDDTTVLPGNIPEGIPDRYSSSSSSSSSQGKDLKAEEPPVDNPPPPFESVMPKEALTEEPKTEQPKPRNGKDDAYLEELKNLVAQVKTKYPRYPIEQWYGRNIKAPPDKIIQVLRNFCKADLKCDGNKVIDTYLQNSIDVETGKTNARLFEAEQEGKKGPTTARGMAAMRQIMAGIGAHQ